ncbi:MAG TPA: nitrophenyl compound nitroreductase subunit ArsF family protein [Bacteroidales bacterium]|nr:nitrophenyl compound nitroreductase subunit ArsF family protein [Bacteroidales bacterium]HPS70638.1 nitrophenyl compound nitroreductase subunit ArsF family protein [Bacteroidales bacterium]
MKKTVLFLALFIGIFSSFQSVQAQNQTDSVPKIRIYYFHATNRCATCLACENVCLETLQAEFQKELDSKIIIFEPINIEEEQNKSLVVQYKIQFSTLLFVDQKGNVTDLSDKAFENAIENPAEYKKIIVNQVLKMLN